MSFSFSIRAVTTANAKDQVAAKLAEVAASQPLHEKDIGMIEGIAGTYIDFAGEPAEGKLLAVWVNGSIWFAGDVLGGASAGVNIGFVPAE